MPKTSKGHELKIKALVAQRSDGLCERCGREGHTFHHRKNRSAGGEWSLSNIVHLCGDGTQLCHGWVTTHPAGAFLDGYHLHSWDEPSEFPIRLHFDRFVLLDVEDPSYTDYLN
jgi:hypothetical protein